MTGIGTNAVGLTLALQSQSAPTAEILSPLKTSQSASASETDAKAAEDDKKAREAANKFEALLIHNMLKSMRKTTMSENKSNSQSIYEDMYDEKIADTMMQSGGIGVADQILLQIRQQKGQMTAQPEPGSDVERLRELAKHIERPVQTSAASSAERTTDTTRLLAAETPSLSMASRLWGGQDADALTQEQLDFVMPLIPHARRNAQKLGTSPHAILAIAALETGWGQSPITNEDGNDSHNLFGIKASASDQRYANTVTTEYLEGVPQKEQARFKTFDNKAEAVDGFAHFILSNPRYSQALQNASNPEQFLSELQDAGYATDPRYAQKAISILRRITGNPLPL